MLSQKKICVSVSGGPKKRLVISYTHTRTQHQKEARKLHLGPNKSETSKPGYGVEAFQEGKPRKHVRGRGKGPPRGP